MSIVMGTGFTDDTDEGVQRLYAHISGEKPIPAFSGELTVVEGVIQNEVSVINARSLAENVLVFQKEDEDAPYSGSVKVAEGAVDLEKVIFRGESLVHSAPLTAIAFTKGFFGDYGKYIVSIGLLLFAFSTAISWSYYGDRAMTFLGGPKSVVYFRIVYVLAFFYASFQDTAIIWTLSGITIALMTLPNLVGIFLLRKDMKNTISEFWTGFRKEYPDEKKLD